MKKKILVVDDDEGILVALRLLLERERYDVETCADGDMVVTVAKDSNPDLILMDLLLSGKDGTDLALELRNKEHTKDIPIVMMSAHPNAEKKVTNAGVKGFVSKPFEIDSLLQTIQKYMAIA